MHPLARTAITAFSIQFLGAAISVPLQTDLFYDLFGSAGFLLTSLTSLRATTPSTRAYLLTITTALWATRLGSHLFERALKQKGDPRFDEMKKKPIQFAGAWTMQALWTFVTALPVYVVNARESSGFKAPKWGRMDYIGIGIWTLGITCEIIADRQKKEFKRKQAEGTIAKDEFLHSGLWARSRYPNYFGESLLWTGSYILATSSLIGSPLLWICALSPVFETFLLTQVSGIPLIQKYHDKKHGGNAKYNKWKSETPLLIPKWSPTIV